MTTCSDDEFEPDNDNAAARSALLRRKSSAMTTYSDDEFDG